jgi:hypothetical protein
MAVHPHALRHARRLLTYIVEENGTACEVEFASGEILRCGAGNPRIFVKFHNDRVLLGDLSEFSFGKAYLNGEWDVEGDTLKRAGSSTSSTRTRPLLYKAEVY